MRINLRLKKFQFCGSKIKLLHTDVFYEFPDLFYHPVKTGSQDSQLIIAVLTGTYRKISLSRLPCHFAETLNRLCNIQCNLTADQKRPYQDERIHHYAHPQGCHHVSPDLLTKCLQIGCLIIDIPLDLILDQFCQYPDIHIQPLHIFIVGTAYQSIIFDLFNPVFQRIETLQYTVQTVSGIIRIRFVIKLPEVFSRFLDHHIRLFRIYQFFRPLRVDHNDIHQIIHIFFKRQVIGVCHGNIRNDTVISR